MRIAHLLLFLAGACPEGLCVMPLAANTLYHTVYDCAYHVPYSRCTRMHGWPAACCTLEL